MSSITEDVPKGIRLKPLDDVSKVFSALREPLVVSKPLVESHRARELLQHFRGSRALWTYRDYRDVVNSDVKLFHSQVESCRIIVDGVPGNWRSEAVPERALELIRSHYDEQMSRHDAAALIWYARNSLYFEQNLQTLPSVRLWKYDDFVQNPEKNAYQIYAWLKMTPPGRRALNFVSARSVGLGHNVNINEEIEAACSELLRNLDKRYNETVVGTAAGTSSA
jgi:hypothetical protein